jgi:hypothetical protein
MPRGRLTARDTGGLRKRGLLEVVIVRSKRPLTVRATAKDPIDFAGEERLSKRIRAEAGE